ncbi:hypothetical protein SAMN06295912_11860 [Sphingomonas laterariae]|uniref:Uncharacterized protein n=1 Tax=Edaphosphingomonas laterariae TaxID=861865 RepID=A0A239HT00_9SPHN|nr:hypothetical protein [Sphingomonas laterariae]SNS83424.1 hypothetical protein SAMN06295912_11860 [Sphingomonas laterariae]
MAGKIAGALIAGMLVAAAPAMAGNSLVAPGSKVQVAKSGMSIRSDGEWNKLGRRLGPNTETWTIDGDELNDVTFYGGIADGLPIFREVDKKNRPLPRVSSTMLVTDIPTLFETSYRIAYDTPLMKIDTVEPTSFAGGKGVRFTYSFTRPNEELHRKGEARAAVVGGKLFLITYEAPTLHYFDKTLPAFRQLADSAAF